MNIFIGLVDGGPALRQHWFNVWWLLGSVKRICHSIQLLGGGGVGGGLEFLNWINYLFHLLSAIFYLFHTLPQAKYLFDFLRFFIQSTVLDPKVGLVLMWGVKETSEERIYKLKSLLIMCG